MGKSLAYMTAALASGKRIAILTANKALQSQVADDFTESGLFDMRGLNNYTCRALDKGGELETMWNRRLGRPGCDIGPCTAGMPCALKEMGCDYFDAYRRACGQQIVSTNYDYWIAIHKYGQGLGKFDWLIMDEAHEAVGKLSDAMSVEFTEKDFKELGKPPKIDMPLQNWRMWARVFMARVQSRLEAYTHIGGVDEDGVAALIHDSDLPDAEELRFWKRLENKCQTLSDSTDDWVLDVNETNGNIRIAPVWVNTFAEPYLFRDIKRVILTSATVLPKVASLLGMPDNSWEYIEYPSTFPVERRPIYWMPTIRLNYRSPEEDLRTWVVRIDQILSRRMDRKGIVHTVSYARQKFLLENSRFAKVMYANASGNTRDVVKAFRAADPPAVLVSPSVGTGFDFPFDAARYQIIGKVPFRDSRGSIIKAQAEEDPDYLNYLTAQDLIQLYGRTNRDPKDFSETWIVDNCIEKFIQDYKRFFPQYYLEAFQTAEYVNEPPPLEAIV